VLPVLPVVSSAVSEAGFEALSCPPLTLSPFFGWKIATELLGVSEFLVASSNAGTATVRHLSLSRCEHADANCEQQN
jgi:hypothetical protein